MDVKFPDLMKTIPAHLHEEKHEKQLIESVDSHISTLGLAWNTNKDVLSLTYSGPQAQSKLTKRQALSCIAKIYDP